MAKKTVAAKKRNVKVDAMGQLHVHSSFNNPEPYPRAESLYNAFSFSRKYEP